MSRIPINNTLQLQSPYLYCQAAGSDGSDGTRGGAHLRWDLMKELGYNHLPKGNLAGSGEGFNKPEDFVSIYRGAFLGIGGIAIDFTHIDAHNISFLSNSAGIVYHDPGTRNNIIVRLLNRAKFRSIIDRGLDPHNPLQDFLNRYNGIIEVEVEGKLMMRYVFDFASGEGEGDANIETVSTKDRLDPQAVHVVKRENKAHDELLNSGIDTTAENIKYFRIQQNGMPAPLSLMIYTYEDVFNTIQEKQSWEKIGDFSLSLDDTQVFTWFQGYPYTGGDPDLQWPKFNDGVQIQTNNYFDRWVNGDGGLKDTITQYIQLSDTDPRAMINLMSQDPGDTNGLTVSMLDMLKIVGLDYHGARMMGLGCLDDRPVYEHDYPFIYAAVYTTYPSLPKMGENNDHVFLTLPTMYTDYRLPVAPRLLDPTYGLYISTDENSEPELISDPNGYSFYDDVRFINLNKENVNGPQPVRNFIPRENFDATTITQPGSFGIEYRWQGNSNWVAPEILHDDEYNGSDGNPETVTTPEKDGNPIYTHRETDAGIHEYALYSVNWFSRVSGISNIVQTDTTVFTKRNTLLPPFNFSVQYIQEEDPLIFTTQNEQNELDAANAANPNGDNYKTRVTFDWNNLHNNAYQSANKIEFFFRDLPIKKIEGQITSVTSISTTECMVSTGPFTMASVNPPLVVSPMITQAEESFFVGSLLNTPEGQFQIVSVQASTPGPVFVVKKLVSTQTIQATPDDPIITIPVYDEPNVNDIFFVFENVSETNQWAKLNRIVDLYNFSNATEIIYEDDGSTHTEVVGGINGNATITEIPDPNNPNAPTGGYTVQFNAGVNLPVHPGVVWIKGSARFTMNNFPNKKKRLPVVSIQQSNPIKIVVFDPDYAAEPTERILIGNNIPVNFHPGYKLYLSPEPGVFDKTKTMPVGTANNKKTYLAARSADMTIPLYSSLTQPAILVARNIQKPVIPEAILGPLFATRPDFYGKSTYTLDIRLNINSRIPFGVVVYRAHEMSILQTLYKPETLQQVIADLAASEGNDPYRFNRWRSLVEVEVDPNDNNKFKLFGSYRFPNPDNGSTEIFPTRADSPVRPFPLQAGETILTKRSIIKKTIEDIFSSMTETPIVFEYLKTGYQTSPEVPKTRSIIGRLLSPSDADFSPFPMAVKFPATNPNTVRFTDYTLSGNSRNIYFYFAREIAVDTKLSERTAVSGPVILVDAAPAEKPKIARIISQEAFFDYFDSAASPNPPAVAFELAEYIDAEKIKQYQVFRTTNFSEAATVRTMKLAATVNINELVLDNFSDLTQPPFGQPLYYRIVALREIVNEQGQTEMIPSLPSELVLTNIIDTLHPAAPVITPSIGTVQTTPPAYLNVTLLWPQTVYNGTYYLYRMTAGGNWELIWSKKTNAAQISFPENGDFVTSPQTAYLPKEDELGNIIYHRFKVMVENANSLINQEEKELTI